jgi:glycosyltransferase involved in cell wall biosynthesis
VWTRQNHFTRRLARLGAEVLYVENPPAWGPILRRRAWHELPVATVVREVEPGLRVMRPGLSLPGTRRSDAVARWNARRLARQARDWLERHGWDEYTAWCRVPWSAFVLEHLRPSRVVYDITDDYELFETSPEGRRRARAREDRLLSQSDVVFFASRDLQQRRALQGVPHHWVPNGMDYDLFARAAEPGEVHPVVRAMPRPVIGYVGLTTHWMDFELLERLGRRWPDQVVMVGPVAPEVAARARAVPGVVWAGFVPQPELVPWLRGFDVCVMPHLDNDLVRRSNPLKIWEYLATGKPIVSVDLPALDPVREFVDAARDRDHFMELVELRLRQPRARPPSAAQAAAREFSWDNIFAGVLRHLAPQPEAVAA